MTFETGLCIHQIGLSLWGPSGLPPGCWSYSYELPHSGQGNGFSEKMDMQQREPVPSVITFRDVNDAPLTWLLINAFASLWGFDHRSGNYRVLCLAINISFRKLLLPWLSPWLMKMTLPSALLSTWKRYWTSRFLFCYFLFSPAIYTIHIFVLK